MRVAILDDYQNVALSMADWSDVAALAEITVFNDHLADPDDVVERLAPFDVVCVMRERTPLPRDVIERLPRLKMIASTGPFNAAVDVAAAKERGIYVSTTGGYVESTVELTWALILAAARRRHRVGRARIGTHRRPGGPSRQGVRHGHHRVEREPDARSRRTSRGDLRVERRIVQPRRRLDHPSGAQRALSWPRRYR
jgi:lactate dehydrogenase-like 2-hydroxyacid dehydrogenase